MTSSASVFSLSLCVLAMVLLLLRDGAFDTALGVVQFVALVAALAWINVVHYRAVRRSDRPV